MQQQDNQKCGCIPSRSIIIELPNCSLYWGTGQQPHSDNNDQNGVQSVMGVLDMKRFAVLVDREAQSTKLSLTCLPPSASSECPLKQIAPEAVISLAEGTSNHQGIRPIDPDCLATADNRERVVAVNSIFQHWLLGDGCLQNVAIVDSQLKIIDQHYSQRVSTPREPRSALLVVDEQEHPLRCDPALVRSELQNICRRVHSFDTILKFSDQQTATQDDPYEQGQMWLVQLLKRTDELIKEHQLDVEPFSAVGMLEQTTREELAGRVSRLHRLGLISDVEAEQPVDGNKTVGQLLLHQIFLRIMAEDSSITRRQISFLKNLRVVKKVSKKLLNSHRIGLLLRLIQKADLNSSSLDQQLACRAFQFLAMCGCTHLQNLNFSNLDLHGCDIRGCTFYCCTFLNSNLADCRIDQRTAFLECLELDESQLKGGNFRYSELESPFVEDNLVVGQLDNDVVFYNIDEGQLLMKRKVSDWSNEVGQLTLPIAIKGTLRIIDISTGRLLQYAQLADSRHDQLKNGIYYQFTMEVHNSTRARSPHIKRIDLASLEVQLFKNGFERLDPYAIGDIIFSDQYFFFRYYRIRDVTFSYDVRTETTTRMQGIKGSLILGDFGWVIEQTDSQAIFHKQGKAFAWKLSRRMSKIKVMCESPLTVWMKYESRHTHIIDIQNNRLLFECSTGTVAIDKQGSTFNDIKIYHFRSTEERLSKFRQLKLDTPVLETIPDKSPVVTFINKPKFQRIGPVRLLTTSNAVYCICDSDSQPQLLFDGQKGDKLVHNIQSKLLGVCKKDSVQLYRIHQKALTLIHTVRIEELAHLHSKDNYMETPAQFQSIVILSFGLALLKFKRQAGYHSSEIEVFVVFDDESIRLVPNPFNISRFVPVAINGLLCLMMMDHRVYPITEQGTAISLNGEIDSTFAYWDGVTFDSHRRLLELQSVSYSYDFNDSLELISIQRSLGYIQWSKVTLISEYTLVLEKEQHIYLQQRNSFKKLPSKWPCSVFASRFFITHKQFYTIRKDQSEVYLEVLRIGGDEPLLIDTAILRDFLKKENSYSLTILEGRVVAADKEGGLLVYDAPGWLPRRFAVARPVKACVQHSSTDAIYLLDNLSVVSCLNMRTSSIVREVAIQPLRIPHICKTTADKLYYLNGTGKIHIYDCEKEQQTSFSVPHEEFISELVLTEDAATACIAYKSTWVVGLDLATGSIRFSMRGFDSIRSLQCLGGLFMMFDASSHTKTATRHLNKLEQKGKEQDYDEFLDPQNVMKLSNSRVFIIDAERPPRKWVDHRQCSHAMELFLLHEVDQPSSLRLLHK